VPSLSSSLICPALEQLEDLPADDCELLEDPCPGLRECLAQVPDPRDPRGVRHTLASLLLSPAAALLAGARSLTAVGEWVADAPPQVLASRGVRYDPMAGRSGPPDEATIRRVLESLDADALDAAVGSWLSARPGHSPVAGPRPAGGGRGRQSPCAAPGAPAATGRPRTCWRRSISRPARGPGRPARTARPMRSPGSRRCWNPLDLAGAVVTAEAAYPARAREVPGQPEESALNPGRDTENFVWKRGI